MSSSLSVVLSFLYHCRKAPTSVDETRKKNCAPHTPTKSILWFGFLFYVDNINPSWKCTTHILRDEYNKNDIFSYKKIIIQCLRVCLLMLLLLFLVHIFLFGYSIWYINNIFVGSFHSFFVALAPHVELNVHKNLSIIIYCIYEMSCKNHVIAIILSLIFIFSTLTRSAPFFTEQTISWPLNKNDADFTLLNCICFVEINN